jgi:hypothetical protein
VLADFSRSYLKRAQAGETQTVLLLKDLASLWGWVQDGTRWEEQRIWFNRTMDGTKYAGMVPAATGDEGSTGRPDGILWAAGDDYKTRNVLALVELKADPGCIDEAVTQLTTCCTGLLAGASGLKQVLGVAVAGSEMSDLVIKVFLFAIDDRGVVSSKQMTFGADRKPVNWFPTPLEVEQFKEVRASCVGACGHHLCYFY